MPEVTSSAIGQAPGADQASAGQTPTSSTGQTSHDEAPQAGLTPDQQAAQLDEGGGGQTPKPFDDEYVRSLRSEVARSRKELKAFQDREKEREDRDKSEMQKATERADAAEKRAAQFERQQARTDVAVEKGIPQFAARLQGSTREELEADADELKRLLEASGQAPRTPSFDAGVRPYANGGGSDMNSLIRAAAGRQ